VQQYSLLISGCAHSHHVVRALQRWHLMSSSFGMVLELKLLLALWLDACTSAVCCQSSTL
jgi:pentatricopeptide repeat protein